jgi:hypothetical protein
MGAVNREADFLDGSG